MTSRRRRWLVTVLKYAIALVALAWLGGRIEVRSAIGSAGELGLASIAIVLVVTLLEFGSRFSMWYVLLNARRSTPLLQSIRVDLVVKHVNMVLPSKASGHSLAPLVVHHYTNHDWPESIALAATNTGLYASLYGTVALAGLVITAPSLGPGLLALLTGTTIVYGVVGVLALGGGRSVAVLRRPIEMVAAGLDHMPLVGARLGDALSSAGAVTASAAPVLKSVTTRPAIVGIYAIGWLGTLVVFPAARVLVVLSALGAPFSDPLILPLVLVLAYGVTVLPVTPGGIGISEVSATLVLVAFGVPEATAAVAIVIDRSLGVYLPALLGWIPLTRLDLSAVLESRPS